MHDSNIICTHLQCTSGCKQEQNIQYFSDIGEIHLSHELTLVFVKENVHK